jgi:uncharacterized protein YjiS (DUF1127 family)
LPATATDAAARKKTRTTKMAYASGIRGSDSGLIERVASVTGSLRDGWRRFRVYRQTLRELNALGDRELADLGIHRSNIGAIANEAAYGA